MKHYEKYADVDWETVFVKPEDCEGAAKLLVYREDGDYCIVLFHPDTDEIEVYDWNLKYAREPELGGVVVAKNTQPHDAEWIAEKVNAYISARLPQPECSELWRDLHIFDF